MNIPNDHTACEQYGGYTIALRAGVYSAFTNFLGKPVPGVSGSTRAEVRRQLDQRMTEAGSNTISSGSFPLEGGGEFRWMLSGEKIPEITGWIEKDHRIVSGTYGFWRTPDPDEALKRACAAFELQPIKED